jgi:ABC-type sugar transport system ATPase subunit
MPGAAAAERVEFGIRPEHLVEVATGAPGLATRIELVEPLGADTLVSARLGEHALVARLPGESIVRPGEVLTLGIDARRAHLFDTASGRRLGGTRP